VDYLKAPVLFKLKKTLRYCKLYGPRRTLAKVRGQLHMDRVFDELPTLNANAREGQTVGIICCGNYAFSNIAYYLNRRCGRVIRGVMDVDVNRSASLGRAYHAAYYTTDAEEIMNDPTIDLVYVASNHASHAEYAICALNRGKNVYIEKPHVVSEDQLVRLVEAVKESAGKAFLGFNRPKSRLGRLVREYLGSESGPGMYNWFIAGHAIDPDHWYFRPEEGGRVLGNLCHWTDFILNLCSGDTYPVEINPTRAEKGDCDIAVTYKFSDGSIAAITFSAKGHTFEGVREKFAAHRGNCLLEMNDFQTLKIEVVDRVRKYRNLYRDHGHETTIISCFENVRRSLPFDREPQVAYIWDTAMLFLKTKEALEKDSKVIVHPYLRTRCFGISMPKLR